MAWLAPTCTACRGWYFAIIKNYEGSRDTFSITSVTRAQCARRFLCRTQRSHFYWLIPSYGLKILLKVSEELPEDTVTFCFVSFPLPPFLVYFIRCKLWKASPPTSPLHIKKSIKILQTKNEIMSNQSIQSTILIWMCFLRMQERREGILRTC